ncbi:hypothetical protein [Mycolicibacterium porcinum]
MISSTSVAREGAHTLFRNLGKPQNPYRIGHPHNHPVGMRVRGYTPTDTAIQIIRAAGVGTPHVMASCRQLDPVQRWESGKLTVKARLEGGITDLKLLARFIGEGDVQVLEDDDGYYLAAADIDSPPAGLHFYDVARMHLSTVNGLGRLIDLGFVPVRLSGTYQDGEVVHQVISPPPAIASLRCGIPTVTITNADGTVYPGSPSPWPKRAGTAASHPEAARVLRILARNEDLDWYDLYKIHEIIRRDIEPDKLDKIGWTTKAQDSAFTVSADRYEVSGDAARHAVDSRKESPKNTMTIGEGRAYIGSLITQWLDYLAVSNEPRP